MTITEIELMPDNEYDRMSITYMKLNQIIDNITDLGVFPSLMWVWTWDIIKDKLDSYSPDGGEDYVVNDKFTEADVFQMFWQDIDKYQFTLEYGSEALDDSIFEWMIDKDIVHVLDDDAWLNSDDDEENSDEEVGVTQLNME